MNGRKLTDRHRPFTKTCAWAILIASTACAQAISRPSKLEATKPDDTARTVTETTFKADDGRDLKAVLSIPDGKGPFPVVISLHGGAGGREYHFLRAHSAPEAGSSTVQMLNARPWAVYAIGFRRGAILGAEEDDVLAGIRAIKLDPRINPDRVAVFGGSHGGQLALRAAIRMRDELSCAAAGSPWMINPQLFFYGDPSTPPLSELSHQARSSLLDRRASLIRGLSRNTGVAEPKLKSHLASRSIEEHIGEIRVPILLLTSRSDVQVPHRLLERTIAEAQARGRRITVHTVNDSLHGFYWGREGETSSRAGAGPKTTTQIIEERDTLRVLESFLVRCLGTGN